jgi:tetratricopeptide (TPR) repeat protein
MGKRKSRKKHKSPGAKPFTSTDASRRILDSHPLSRVWPAADKRAQTIKNIEMVPEEKRNHEQYYVLGCLLVLKGGLQDDQELLSRGIQYLKSAADVDRPLPQAVLELSWISAFLHFQPLELKYAQKAVELYPQKPDAWKFKGLVHLHQGQRDECLACMQKACSLPEHTPEDKENLSRLQKGGSMPLGEGFLFPASDFGSLHNPPAKPEECHVFNFFVLRNCLAFESENSELLFEAALHAFFLHRLDEALEYCSRLLQCNDKHADGLALYGYIHEKNKEINKAVDLYRRALDADPGHPFANTNLARYLLSSGCVFLAQEHLKKALSAAPEYPEALDLYGRVLAQGEEPGEQSLEYHRKALQLEPEMPDYHLHYCLSALQIGSLEKLTGDWSFHKKYIQAFTDNGALRRLLNLVLTGSRDPLQNAAIAETLNQNGFHRSARIFVQRAWKKAYTVEEKKQKEFYYFTGLQSSRCNELEISLEAYKKLELWEGKGKTATTFAAMILNRLGKNEEALEAIQHCDMHDGWIITLAGNIQWSLGRYEESLENLMKAMEQEKPRFLTVYYGMKYAVQRRHREFQDRFMELGETHWPDSNQMLCLRAEALMVRGKHSEVIDILKNKLYKNGKPLMFIMQDEKKHQSIDEHQYELYFLLGCAFIQMKRDKELQELLEWLTKTLPDRYGSWEVLQAEDLRVRGKIREALDCLSESNTHPQAQMTRALCYREEQSWEEAEKTVDHLLHSDEYGKIIYHPAGSMKAVACAILSQIQRARGDAEISEKTARTACDLEPENPLVRGSPPFSGCV